MAAKVSKPVIYAGVATLVVAFFMMSSQPEPTGTKGKTLAELRAGNKSKATAALYPKEDFEARFERLNEDPKNAFMPLVAKFESGMTGGGLAPNEFPVALVGGEVGWFYTGTVIENDVPSALVENQLTGEGMYLKVGDRLKQSVITKIAPTYITVSGQAGMNVRLDLLADPPEIENGFGNLAVEPVRPNVNGIVEGPRRPTGQIDRGFPGIEEENEQS